HTRRGYATTNNPVKVFNKAIKVMTQRQILQMPKLIQTLLEFIREQSIDAKEKGREFQVSMCIPQAKLMARYRAMMGSGWLLVAQGRQENLVTVNHVNIHAVAHAATGSADRNNDEVDIQDDDFVAFLEDHFGVDVPAAEMSPTVANNEEFEAINVTYLRQKSKWSSRLLETFNKPFSGWSVDIDALECPCRYWCKTGICVHLIAALKHKNILLPGDV
ncbi:MAG: hypothetical protein ACRDL7_13175, partial [Gaiellaceae bacterium]